ncbi:hypothetical protein LTR36_008367 [Oleoguttula mirabilis]|uniref:C2H2-domain containing protein second zinc finger domain-containing protein n=1 Tax=Oleoguttula mirabilis TaxID=1507867 RepID=A0AAV9J7W9_9PEZI|nr:hypothetical protein LTR36_008367 [Oleoguttula mirabilis]
MDYTNPDRSFASSWNVANDAHWLTNAMALDDLVVPASQDAETTRPHHPVTDPAAVVICSEPSAIPAGRQRAKLLKCGIAGCTYTKLFDRKYELERHMKTYGDGAFACYVVGCERMIKAFTRLDKLREHVRKVHGMRE